MGSAAIRAFYDSTLPPPPGLENAGLGEFLNLSKYNFANAAADRTELDNINIVRLRAGEYLMALNET